VTIIVDSHRTNQLASHWHPIHTTAVLQLHHNYNVGYITPTPHFSPRDAMHSTVLVIVNLSVCLSVCHTRGLHAHMVRHTRAFDLYHRWAWITFEGHFSLLSFLRPISRKLYTIRPQKLKLLIRSYTTAFRWYDCRWPWRYFKVIRLFHIKFLVNGARYGKSYYWLLIGNRTLAFDWCHLWWPWTFEGHLKVISVIPLISAIFGRLSRRAVPKQ